MGLDESVEDWVTIESGKIDQGWAKSMKVKSDEKDVCLNIVDENDSIVQECFEIQNLNFKSCASDICVT